MRNWVGRIAAKTSFPQTAIVGISARAGLILSVLACYFYVASEWLFQVSKKSFLMGYDTTDQLVILATSPLFIIPFAIIPALVYAALRLLLPGKKYGVWWGVLGLGGAIIVTSLTITMLISNFLYTLFDFDIAANTAFRDYAGYVPAALVVLTFTTLFLSKWARRRGLLSRKCAGIATLVLLAVSVSTGLATMTSPYAPNRQGSLRSTEGMPNIVILTTDAWNAENVSFYGYHRETTPYITQMAEQSLVAENMLPNSGNTTASIAAILTGKLPTVDKMIYPPDLYKGKDSVEHMVGLLRGLGYTTGTICVDHFVNPEQRGMVGGFDYANGWLSKNPVHRLFSPYRDRWPNEAFFLKHTLARHYDKLAPLLGASHVDSPFKQVTSGSGPANDPDRVKQACEFIDQAPRPFLLEMHLLGTHGPKFYPIVKKYSQGQKQAGKWMVDFYDDSILTFDMFTRQLLEHLKERRLYENTIIFISSDHGLKWNAFQRLPLVIRFPHGEHRGRFKLPVQHVDFAPTVLSYLHQPIPKWMSGNSIINHGIKGVRPIISASCSQSEPGESGELVVKGYDPPFYSLDVLGMIFGGHKFIMRTSTGVVGQGKLQGYTGPLAPENAPSLAEAQNFLWDHLAKCGYRVEAPKISAQAPGGGDDKGAVEMAGE